MIELERIATLGVSAASGLVRVDDELIVVADDELALHRHALDGTPLGEVRLFEGVLPDDPVARKRAKPDLESLVALPGHRLLALGSCSKPGRERGVLVDAGVVTQVDLAPLAARLATSFDRLNIEGAVVLPPYFVVLTRRTGASGRNAMVRLDLDRVLATLSSATPCIDAGALVDIVDVDLGDVHGVAYGFTDGVAEGDGVVFSAAAEATDDPVEDAPSLGCVIGRMDARGRLVGQWPTTPNAKIEGVALGDDGWLLAVADADDRGVPAPLFRARLPA
jgi:hypothetical protein